MNKICAAFVLVVFFFGCQQPREQKLERLNIIPQPNQYEINDGYFRITSDTKLIYKGLDNTVLQTIKYFQSLISKSTGLVLEITDIAPTENFINFQISAIKSGHNEGYELLSTPESINIMALEAKGLFYAIQSLRQLLPAEIESTTPQASFNWHIPAVYINDYPQFDYRGLNMDVARHYMPVADIKKQLDLLALYKINVFHWHLTDDQGWRIEIKKYPKLTSIGSKRDKTLIGHGASIPLKYDNQPYEGYYSQETIKEIIEYASERHITIIPEIEMPGHALAALTSYPELGCTEGPYEVATRWGDFDDSICPGKELSYTIIQDILEEVALLFPGEYIHIGGDECTKIRWRTCKHCQNKIRKHQLKDENELANYFIRRVQQIVESLGKKMAGWDEIMNDKSLSNATIVMWQDDGEIKEAIKNNNKIVKSPNSYLYFDHYQCEPQNHPLAIGGYTPLKDVYFYEPLSGDLSEKEKRQVIGMQANCWTEYINNGKRMDYMLYPRMCAFSEISWTQKDSKDWSCFIRRLTHHYKRLKQLNVSYFYEVPKPIVEDGEQLNFISSTHLEFKFIADTYEIRYTTDGSEPHEKSKLYTQKLPVKSSGTIKAITINKSTNSISKTAIINLNQLKIQKPVKNKSKLQPGLKYTLHQGRFKTVKEIKNISKSEEGVVTNSFIPDSIQNEGFGLIITGYYQSVQQGIYEFAMNSDDGSALYINDQLVVNNDGIHGNKIEKGAIALNKGLYKFKLYYFQTTGYMHFNLNVVLPDKTDINLIPADFYY